VVDTTEEPDDSEELWDGGPTFGQIKLWKKEFANCDIYVTSVTPEKHFVWRTMTRAEYRNLVKQMEQQASNGMSQAEVNLNNEETAAELCIIFPKYQRTDAISQMAGVASIIS